MGRLLDRPQRAGPGRDDDINLKLDEVRGEHRIALGLPFCPAVLDVEILPLNPSQVAQALPKRCEGEGLAVRVAVADESEARYLPHRLRCDGARRCEQEQRQQDESAHDTTPHDRLLASAAHQLVFCSGAKPLSPSRRGTDHSIVYAAPRIYPPAQRPMTPCYVNETGD
jgi:hypothetical protein